MHFHHKTIRWLCRGQCCLISACVDIKTVKRNIIAIRISSSVLFSNCSSSGSVIRIHCDALTYFLAQRVNVFYVLETNDSITYSAALFCACSRCSPNNPETCMKRSKKLSLFFEVFDLNTFKPHCQCQLEQIKISFHFAKKSAIIFSPIVFVSAVSSDGKSDRTVQFQLVNFIVHMWTIASMCEFYPILGGHALFWLTPKYIYIYMMWWKA